LAKLYKEAFQQLREPAGAALAHRAYEEDRPAAAPAPPESTHDFF
jgi:hypothetical protein